MKPNQPKPSAKEVTAARREFKAAERAMERLPFGDNEALDALMSRWTRARSVLAAAALPL